MYKNKNLWGKRMCKNKEKPNMEKNSKTDEKVFIEKRIKLFLKAAKEHPERFRYGIKPFNCRPNLSIKYLNDSKNI